MNVRRHLLAMFPGYRLIEMIAPIALACLIIEFILIQFTPNYYLPMLKSILGWISLFFMPGFLLLMVLFREELYLGEILPMSFALGLVTFSFMGLLSYALKAPMSVLLASVALEVVILLAVLARTPVKLTIRLKDFRFWVLLAVALCFSAIFIKAGAIQAGDAYTHLAWIRRLTERGVADPSAFGILPNGPVYPEYVYDTWHLAIAFISRVTRIDPILIWTSLPVFLVPFFILSFWALAKQLFHSIQLAFFTTLFYICFAAIYQGAWTWWLGPYPDQIAKFLLIVTLTLFLKFVERGERKFLVLTAITATSTLLIHVQSFFYFMLFISSYGIFCMLVPNEKRHASRGLKVFIAAAVLSIPVLIPKLYLLSGPLSYNLHYHSLPLAYWAKARGLISLPFSSFINNYKLILTPIRIMSLGALPFLVFKALRKRETWAILLSSGLIGIVLVAFNPILVTLLSKINVILVTRMGYPLDLLGIFIAGFLTYKIAHLVKLKKAWLYDIIGGMFFLLGSIGVLVMGGQLPKILRPPGSLVKTIRINKFNNGTLTQANPMAWVGENTRGKSVILTDSNTAMRLIAPSFDRYVIPFGTACTPMGTYPEIYYDVKKILNPEYDIVRVFPILTRYDVDYVLTRSLYLTKDTDIFYQYRPCKLNVVDPLVFEEINSRGGYTLYKVRSCSLQKLTDYYLTKVNEKTKRGGFLESFRDISIASRLATGNSTVAFQKASVVTLALQQALNDIKQGNIDNAYRILKSVGQLTPNSREVQFLLGEVCREYFEKAKQAWINDRLDSAFIYARKALLADADSIEVRDLLEKTCQKLLEEGKIKLIVLNNITKNNGEVTKRITYSYSRSPDYWSPKGDELLDGKWNSPTTCVAWYLYGDTVTISIDLQKEYLLQSISVISNFFTKNYAEGGMGIRIFVGQDRNHFVKINKVCGPSLEGEKSGLGQGIHYWKANTYERVRYIRVIVSGYGLIPIGEIQIKAYILTDVNK